MNTQYRSLGVSLASADTRLTYPSHDLPQRVGFDSPAIDVMTDLARTAAVTVEPSARLEEAEARMKYARVRLLFVLQTDGTLLGLVTLNDIKGERPLNYQREAGVNYRDITAKDIMTPLERLETLAMREVAESSVGDVIETLKQTGRQHALVVERTAQGHRIRGIFSARQIGRQLGMQIHTAGIAYTFAELEMALTH
jgi:CBS domain containing-hemolysin-like protein